MCNITMVMHYSGALHLNYAAGGRGVAAGWQVDARIITLESECIPKGLHLAFSGEMHCLFSLFQLKFYNVVDVLVHNKSPMPFKIEKRRNNNKMLN